MNSTLQIVMVAQSDCRAEFIRPLHSTNLFNALKQSRRNEGEIAMGGLVNTSEQGKKLNGKSLKAIFELFRGLPAPELSEWEGEFRGEVVGPIWIRLNEGGANVTTGVRGWIGKEFYASKTGSNLVKRGGKIQRVAPLKIGTVKSYVDGKNSPAIIYPDASFPVNKVRDEIRVLDENCLLCLIKYDVPILRHFLFPFLLHRKDSVNAIA